MEGYVLAKKGNQYLVMPKEYYYTEISEDFAADENMLHLLECRCADEKLEKSMSKLGSRDYFVEVNTETEEIVSVSQDKHIKQVYFIGKGTRDNYFVRTRVKGEDELKIENNRIASDSEFIYEDLSDAKIKQASLYKAEALYLFVSSERMECISTPILLSETIDLKYRYGWDVMDGKLYVYQAQEHAEEETVVLDENGTKFHFGVWTGHTASAYYGNTEEYGFINDAFSFELHKLRGELVSYWEDALNKAIETKEWTWKNIVVAYTEQDGEIKEVYDARHFEEQIPWEREKCFFFVLKAFEKKYFDAEQTSFRFVSKNEEKQKLSSSIEYCHIDKNKMINRYITEKAEAVEQHTKECIDWGEDVVTDEFFWVKEAATEKARYPQRIAWDIQPESDISEKIIENSQTEFGYQFMQNEDENSFADLVSWNEIVPCKDEAVRRYHEAWFCERVRKILLKEKSARAVIRYRISRKDENQLLPVLVWIKNDVMSWNKKWYISICEDKIKKDIELIEKYNAFINKAELSEIEFEEFYFLSMTIAEYMNEAESLCYTFILKNLFLMCLKMNARKGIAVPERISYAVASAKYDSNSLTDYKVLRHWAEDVVKDYLSENEISAKQKEWMLRLLVRLPLYYSIDVLEVLEEKLPEEAYKSKLGITKQELNALLDLTREYLENIRNTDFNIVFPRMKVLNALGKEQGFDLEEILFGPETRSMWNCMKTWIYDEKEHKVRNCFTYDERMRIATQIAMLKKSPILPVTELIVKQMKDCYGVLSAPPSLTIECREPVLYKNQEKLRFYVTNKEKQAHHLEAVPAYLSQATFILNWQEKEDEKKGGWNISSTASCKIQFEEMVLLPGETRLLEIPLSELENSGFWDSDVKDETLNCTIEVSYKGDFYEAAKEEWRRNVKLTDAVQVFEYVVKSVESEAFRIKIGHELPKVNDLFLCKDVCRNSSVFVGREDEKKKIVEWICSKRKYQYLIGQKSCGKSSLLAQITCIDREDKHFKERQYDFCWENFGLNKEETGVLNDGKYNDIIAVYFSGLSALCKGKDKEPWDTIPGYMRYTILYELKNFIKKNMDLHPELQEDVKLKELCFGYRQSIFTEESERSFVVKALRSWLDSCEEELSQEFREQIEKTLSDLKDCCMVELRSARSKKSLKNPIESIGEEEFLAWLEEFNRCMKKYHKYYKIILVLDEFTTLCREILEDEKKKKSGKDMLTMILKEGFGTENIYVLAVGHESLKRQIDVICQDDFLTDVSNFIRLDELSDEELNGLLMSAFADSEETSMVFEKEALQYLHELSGNNINVLKTIARRIAEDYRRGTYGRYITALDVEECAKAVERDKTVIDPFIYENPNEVLVNGIALNYLKKIAEIEMRNNGICKKMEILNWNHEVQNGVHSGRKIHDVLKSRGVIREESECVNIKVGLLKRYLLLEG